MLLRIRFLLNIGVILLRASTITVLFMEAVFLEIDFGYNLMADNVVRSLSELSIFGVIPSVIFFFAIIYGKLV